MFYLKLMRKLHIIYIAIIAVLLIAVFCIWQSKVIFWQTADAVQLEPGTAITIWAAVLTIVFLVFSIVGLINIDHRLSELNKTKDEMQKTSLEMREQLSKLKTSTDEEREKIVKGAEAELKKIINESAIRQNLFDELGRVAADPAPDKRAQGYAEILKIYPNLSGVNYGFIHVCRGDAFMQMHKYDKALMEYEEAVKKSPKEAGCYNALGNYYVQMKDYPKSVEYFQKALELKPESDSMLMNIGNSYSAQGQHAEARKYFEKALTFNPDIADVYYNKSVEYNQKDDPMSIEMKMHYLDHCLELNPIFYRARLNKAATYKQMGENEKAINEYTEVITEGVNHDFVMALVERGYNYRQMNQVTMALLSFQQAFFLDPHEIQNLCNLAICYSALGSPHMAYELVLQGLYEVEIQNDHQWENDLMQVLAAVYDKAIDKPAVGPDNVKEYIHNRLTSKTPESKDVNTGETGSNLS